MACWFLDLFEKSIKQDKAGFLSCETSQIFLNTRSRISEREEEESRGQKGTERKGGE